MAATIVPEAVTVVPEGAPTIRRAVPVPRAAGRPALAVLEARGPVPVVAVASPAIGVGAPPVGPVVVAGVAGRRARPTRPACEVAVPRGTGVGTLLGRPVVRATKKVSRPLLAAHPVGEPVGQGPGVVALAPTAQAVPVLTGPNHVAAQVRLPTAGTTAVVTPRAKKQTPKASETAVAGVRADPVAVVAVHPQATRRQATKDAVGAPVAEAEGAVEVANVHPLTGPGTGVPEGLPRVTILAAPRAFARAVAGVLAGLADQKIAISWTGSGRPPSKKRRGRARKAASTFLCGRGTRSAPTFWSDPN